MIDDEFRTDNGNEFQYLGPATLRDEARSGISPCKTTM